MAKINFQNMMGNHDEKFIKLETYDIIVIGAGISGLAAAKILQKEGFDVLILEARNRPGGRIHSVKLIDSCTDNGSQVKGSVVDLGANYLHGCVVEQNIQPLFSLAAKLNVRTAVCPGDVIDPYRGWECPEIAKWRDHISGDEIPLDEVVNMTLLLDKCLSMISSFTKSFNNSYPSHLGITLEKCLLNILEVMHKNNQRSTPFLSYRERGIFDSLLCRYICYINPIDSFPSIYNLEINDNSTERAVQNNNSSDNFNCLKYSYYKYFQEKIDVLKTKGPQIGVVNRPNNRWEDRLVVDGFSKFIDFLVKDLNVLYDSIVKKIDWSLVKHKAVGERGKIKITLHNKKSYECKYCIVSLPVGVLKNLDPVSSVMFIPSIPLNKRKAINNLGIPKSGVETHNKVVLQFSVSDIFWERNYPHIECPDTRLHILNLDFYGKEGVLVAHVWAGSGLYITNRKDEDVVNDLLNILKGMYCKKFTSRVFPKPLYYVVTRWSEDPFSLGSYTSGNITTSDEDRHAYAASLPSNTMPRLLFCGEGTVDSKGAQQCTHGAFLSGVEKAISVLDHINKGPSRINSIRIVDYLTTKSTKLFPPHSMSRRCMRRQLRSPLKSVKKVENKQTKLSLKHCKNQLKIENVSNLK